MTINRNSLSQHRFSQELRCECGQLVARIVSEGLELKCKRCRRMLVIPFSHIKGWTLSQNNPH
jgi:hypothetical protein